MADGNIYGMDYSSTPGLGLQAPSFSSSDSSGAFQPNYSLASTPATSGTTSGGWSTGEKAALGAGIGLGAYELFGGGGIFGGKGGGNINPDPYGMGAQMGAEARQLWDVYNKGEISPADQARIGQWEQQQTQAVKDYYQKAGLSDSSMAQEAVKKVGVDAQNMRMQANQNLLQPALQATNLADQYGMQLVQYQMQQDAQKQQAQQQFMATIGTIAAIAL